MQKIGSVVRLWAKNTFFYALLIQVLCPLASAMDSKLRQASTQVQQELIKTRTRLTHHNFTEGRSMTNRGDLNSQRSSCEDFLDSDFLFFIESLPEGGQILDSGAGTGSAIATYLQWLKTTYPQIFGRQPPIRKLKFTAAIYSPLPKGQFHAEVYEKVILGDLLKANFSSSFDLVMGVYDGFSYTASPHLWLKKILSMLKPGGRHYFVYDEILMLSSQTLRPTKIQNNPDENKIFSNFLVVDHMGYDRTREWFSAIQGATLITQSKFPQNAKWLHLLLKSIQDQVIEYQTAGTKSYWKDQSNREALVSSAGIFIRTQHEEINKWRPITLERTHQAVFVPPLQLIEYIDGRPPHRVYLWKHK